MNSVLNISELPVFITNTLPGQVAVPLQFFQGGGDRINAILADLGKTFGGIVLILRQGQHQGEQPFGF